MIKSQNKFVAVVLLVCSVNFISADDKLKEAMQKMVKQCQEKTGATEADLAALRARKTPETKEGLCLFECFFEHSKVLDDGKYSKEGLVTALTPLMEGDEKKLAKLKEMADICGEKIKTEGDKCENAKILMQCTVEKGKEFGFEYPTYF